MVLLTALTPIVLAIHNRSTTDGTKVGVRANTREIWLSAPQIQKCVVRIPKIPLCFHEDAPPLPRS